MTCLCGHAPNRHTPECDEPGCPCLEMVAEGPTPLPDGYAWEAGWRSVGDTAGGSAVAGFPIVVMGQTTMPDFAADPPTIFDVVKDITARETNTIADLSKKNWTP